MQDRFVDRSDLQFDGAGIAEFFCERNLVPLEARRTHIHREHSVRTLPAIENRSEEHTSELQSLRHLVCRLLLEKKKYPAHTGATRYTVRESAKPKETRAGAGAVGWLGGGRAGNAPGGLGGYASTMFFFNDAAATEIYTLSLHDALPI